MEILSCYACIPLIKIICTPDMTYGSTERIILSFWPIFCPFTPLTAQKLKILKMKKNPGDVIILHKCTKSHDHPLYCSGDVAWDGCNCYFSFWAIFCPFNHLTNRKKKLSKKNRKNQNNNSNNNDNNKNNLEISFYTSVPKIKIICFTGPEIYGPWQM